MHHRMHYQKIPSNKSIKGNPFLHYQVFHQEIPSKEIHFCTIKKFHQTNPSKEIHFCTIKKFHQENPKETIICTIKKIHHNIIILFHQFFSSLLRAYLMGGKSELPTMHKAVLAKNIIIQLSSKIIVSRY